MTTDDATLVRRCLRGEAEAIGLLVGRFQAEVYGLCVRLLNHRHDAEDVCQEVFLRVFRSLDSWDPSRPLRRFNSATILRSATKAKRRADPV